MFGMGSIGNFLPILGSIGSGFSGGGLIGLGFTLLSGLLTNIGSPSSNPGFENFATHPGFNSNHANPGFGSIGGGPNAHAVGSMSGYFGNAYTGNDYSILPHTPSGHYYGNAGYSHGNHGMSYSPNQPVSYGNHYGANIGHLQFGGNFPAYQNSYNSQVRPQTPFFPSYAPGQLSANYGSAPAPYQQSYQPVMSHYGFGSPQQYNPASTLYGHQNGSVQINYGRPQQRTTYGGPQGNNPTSVHHHHHHHIHIHNHGQEAPTSDYQPPAAGDEDTPVSYEPTPTSEPTTDNQTPDTPTTEQPPVSYDSDPQPTPDYGNPDPADTGYPEPANTNYPEPATPNYPQPDPQPPVANDPQPTYPPVTEPVAAPDPAPAVNKPATVSPTVTANNAIAATQTSWGRVPHMDTQDEFAMGSKMVKDRITGSGDSTMYHFGGQNPNTNADGRMNERVAVWHVFQQNESLRLDMDSGQFYNTRPDGTKVNKFHLSAVSNLVRQSGGDPQQGARLIVDFLENRKLAAPGAGANLPVNRPNGPPSTDRTSFRAPSNFAFGETSFG